MAEEKTQNASDQKETKIVMILPTNAYFMSGIRDFTFQIVKNMTKLSEQWAYRFQLIVDELCNNAIEHGSAQNQDIKITFILIPEQSLEVVVEDTGTGKEKRKATEIKEFIEKQKTADITKIGIRGRGLAKIVIAWADQLEFTDREEGGIKASAKKYLNKKEEQILPPGALKGIGAFAPNDPTHVLLA